MGLLVLKTVSCEKGEVNKQKFVGVRMSSLLAAEVKGRLTYYLGGLCGISFH